MNIRKLAALSFAASILGCSFSAFAADSVPATPATAPAAQATAPAPEKTPGEATIRINAPIFSSRFSSIPLVSVNDDVITMEDLKKALGTVHEAATEGKTVPRKDLLMLLKRLTNVKLIIQEAREMGLDKLEENKKGFDDFTTETLRETLLQLQVKNVKAPDADVEKLYAEQNREWRLKSLIMPRKEDIDVFDAALKKGGSFDELYAAAITDKKGIAGGKLDEFVSRTSVDAKLQEVLDGMKPGQVSAALPLEQGSVFYRLEEVRVKEDPEQRAAVRQELDKKARVKALEEYKAGLIKSIVTLDKKLYDKLTYDVSKAQFDKLLKDKRVVAKIKGGESITVSELTKVLESKFFHGIERALQNKKVGLEKDKVYDEILTTRLFTMEVKSRRIADTEEFQTRIKAYTDKVLFNEFISRVIRDDIKVTLDELKAFHKTHGAEYTTPGGYRLDAIAFEDTKKAELALDKLRAGTDFKWYKDNAEGQLSVSKEYFDIFNGTPLAMTSFSDKLKKVISGSASGDYRIFNDGKVNYVVAVLEAVKPEVLPYNVVEESIKERVFYDKLNQGLEEWAGKLRKTSEVVIYADIAKQETP